MTHSLFVEIRSILVSAHNNRERKKTEVILFIFLHHKTQHAKEGEKVQEGEEGQEGLGAPYRGIGTGLDW